MSRGHHGIHYKTCLSHTRTPLTILSDYKRSLCHFWQDLLVSRVIVLFFLLFHAVLFLLKLKVQFLWYLRLLFLKWKYDDIIYLTILHNAAQIYLVQNFKEPMKATESCGYCFTSFEKFPRECLQWKCLQTKIFPRFSQHTETVTVKRCSVKKVFFKNSQISQDSTCVGVSF